MLKILIADDNDSLRIALREVLSRQQGWTVCGEATNGRSAVSMALELKPDVIILDFLMPLMNGLAAAAEISKQAPQLPIVLYTMHMSTQLEREATRVGIKKVVSKTDRFEDFISNLVEIVRADSAPLGPLGLSDNYAERETPADAAANPDSQPGKGSKGPSHS
jgi:DNA-binding NarL/FixJ family response regulator